MCSMGISTTDGNSMLFWQIASVFANSRWDLESSAKHVACRVKYSTINYINEDILHAV